MGYTALYREWRPQQFSDIVGQEHISRTIQNAIKTQRIAHAYLFCGPRGTGKTTTAKVFAKALNCLHGPAAEPCNECQNCKRVTEGASMDVMEIDAASNRGIDEIRDLREKVKFAPTEGKYRIYIIDEVHMLTTEAFNALLKTLEEPPAHVMFILATTEPHKIPLTILSRCQRFDFRRIGLTDIIGRLRTVVNELGIEADDEALMVIARTSEGGMRDALSLLDQCIAFGGTRVTVEDINAVLGTVNRELLFKMAASIIDNDTTSGLKLVDELVRQGKDVRQFAKDFTEHLRNLLLVEVCNDVDDLVPETEETIKAMKEQAASLGKRKIVSLIELFTSTEKEMKWTSQPRLILELAVIKTVEAVSEPAYDELMGRIAKLESMLTQHQTASATTALNTTEIKEPSGRKSGKGAAKPVDKNTGNGDWPYQSVDSQTVLDLWQEILARIKKVRASARAFLIEGEPVKVEQDILVLEFPPDYAFHKEKVEQAENKYAIEKVIKEVTGAELKIKCVFAGETTGKKGVPGDHGSSPLVDKAINMFGGDLIEIKD